MFKSTIAKTALIAILLFGFSGIATAETSTNVLEFKEKRVGENLEYKRQMRTEAMAVLKDILSGKTTFETAGKEKWIEYKESEWTFKSDFPDKKILNAAIKTPKGKVFKKLVESSNGFLIGDHEPIELKGYFIVKTLGIRNASKLPANERAVQVSHILIAYKNAEKAANSVTRSKEEAKKLAQSLLLKLKANEDFKIVAKENSDDPSSKQNSGKLDAPVENNGIYTKEFEKAALSLTKKGKLSNVIETEFGFHIIRADDFTQYKYARIFFLTTTSPWKSTGLTRENVQEAKVTYDSFYQPSIEIKFDKKGTKLFEKITKRNIGKPIAIFMDEKLISEPIVNEKISSGIAVIAGKFTKEEAQELVDYINTGVHLGE